MSTTETNATLHLSAQIAIIEETLTALGYRKEGTAEFPKFVKIANSDTGHAFYRGQDGLWAHELLTPVCGQRPMILGSWGDNAAREIIEWAIEIDRQQVRTEAYEEGAEDMKWTAQRDFEDAYWEYLDGAESDFDPSIYGQRES